METARQKIKTYVDDLNWINNNLHDFATRVAFMEVAEQYINKHKKLNDMRIIMSIYNSMANDAVLRITNIYDKSKKALSIFHLLRWVEKNNALIKSYIHSLNLDFSQSDVDLIRKRINGFQELVYKFKYMRNKLVGHNEKEMVNVVDIRRNLINNKNINTKELFEKSSKEYLKRVSRFLLQTEDFIAIKDHTINAIIDLKELLKMPDRIFGKSGNLEEWKNYYKFQKEEISQLFESILEK